MSLAGENYDFDFAAAAKLPPNILFGTSSWTYPGWQGIVYKKQYRDEKELKAKCLEEYGHFPWFRALGIDSSFYRPTSRKMLLGYAKQISPQMRWVSKVWEEITIPVYAKHARYGEHAGKANPNFLNADMFCSKVLSEHRAADLPQHSGPFVFQFQALHKELLDDNRFLGQLDNFLGQLPKEYQYATEVRNRELLSDDYFKILNRHGATHCFNHWSYMPALRDQMKSAAAVGGLEAPFYVCRILTPRNVSYQQAVDRYQPYNKLQQPIEDMRQDLMRLAKRAVEKKANVFILINNRSEGCSPITIDQVGRMIIKSDFI